MSVVKSLIFATIFIVLLCIAGIISVVRAETSRDYCKRRPDICNPQVAADITKTCLRMYNHQGKFIGKQCPPITGKGPWRFVPVY